MEELTSLNELAKELKVSKSTMNYYVVMGLLKPISTVGGMQLFEKIKSLEILFKIKRERKKGKTLKQIAEDLK